MRSQQKNHQPNGSQNIYVDRCWESMWVEIPPSIVIFYVPIHKHQWIFPLWYEIQESFSAHFLPFLFRSVDDVCASWVLSFWSLRHSTHGSRCDIFCGLRCLRAILFGSHCDEATVQHKHIESICVRNIMNITHYVKIRIDLNMGWWVCVLCVAPRWPFPTISR